MVLETILCIRRPMVITLKRRSWFLRQYDVFRRAMILHRRKLRRYYASRKASLRRRLRSSDGNQIRAFFFQPERWPEPPFVEKASTLRSAPWGLTRGNPGPGGFVPPGEDLAGRLTAIRVDIPWPDRLPVGTPLSSPWPTIEAHSAC